MFHQQLTFNDGCSSLLKVFERCAFEPGHFTELGVAKRDRCRVKSLNQKMLKSTKVPRKKLRAFRKGWEDKNLETEGKLFICKIVAAFGGFCYASGNEGSCSVNYTCLKDIEH